MLTLLGSHDLQVKLAAGKGYGIIVDGKGSQEGLYRLTVSAAEGAVAGGMPPSSLLSSKTRRAEKGEALFAHFVGGVVRFLERAADCENGWDG